MPPLDAALLTALGVLVTAIAALLGGLLKGKQDGASLTRQAVESAQAFWAETLQAQREQAAEQRAEVDRLRSRIEELERSKQETDILRAHAESLHSWIERGKRPPDPLRPPWLLPGAFSPLTAVPVATPTDPKED